MTKKTVEFSKAASFRTDVATAAIITGPTRDGMVHLIFTRDIQIPRSWDVEVEEVPFADGTGERVKDVGQPVVEIGRELVATLVIPIAAAEKLQEALRKLTDFVKSVKEKESAEKK